MDALGAFPYAQHPDFQAVCPRLREELDLGNEYLAGIAFVIIEIADELPPRDAVVLRERLLIRALQAAETSIRRERSQRRKIVDFIFRIDQYLFLGLGSVDATSIKVPLSRLANHIRNDLYATGDVQSSRMRRAVSVGVALWAPQVGFVPEQVIVAKAWESMLEAKQGKGMDDPYSYLSLGPSNLDTLAIAIFDWGQARAQAAPKAEAAPSRPARAPVVARRGPVVEEKTKKPWEFWKK